MSTQEKRIITVFATKGKRTAKIETDVTTWGELRELVKKEGYDVGKLHATENITRHDLAHEGAILPPTPFTLFLRPKKTKSGGKDYDSMGFKDLRAELTADDKKLLSEQTGKNWTRCSTDDLKEYLKNKSGSPAPTAEEADTVEEVVETTESPNAIEATTNADRVALVQKTLSDITENTESQDVKDRVEVVLDEVSGLKDAIDEDESPEAVAAKKAEEEAERKRKEEEEAEKKRLADEANDLMSGF